MEKDLKTLALSIASGFTYAPVLAEDSESGVAVADEPNKTPDNHLDHGFMEKLRASDHVDFILNRQAAA